MVGWYHGLNGHEFEQAPGDGKDREAWRAADDHLLINVKGPTLIVGKSVEGEVTIAGTTPAPVDVILIARNSVAINIKCMATT